MSDLIQKTKECFFVHVPETLRLTQLHPLSGAAPKYFIDTPVFFEIDMWKNLSIPKHYGHDFNPPH
jgi:hypothetical protein